MESISNASCNLGLIAFFFETFVVRYDAPTQVVEQAEQSLIAFISAIKELRDILEAFDIFSRNPISPLPLAFEETAQTCADDIGNLRRDLGKPKFQWRTFKLRRLQEEDVETMTSIFRSYIKLLQPYAELFIRYVCDLV